MTTQNISLSKQQQNINSGFMIKQFKIENPSAFQVYVNISGSVPNRENANFTIQPNSIFTSPPINTQIITIYASGLDVSRGVPKVTFTDEENSLGQTSNVPFATAQFVGALPNYPYTITPNGSFFLPDITLDKFQNLFIQLKYNQNITTPAVLIGITKDAGLTLAPLGGFSQQGGVVSYTPVSVPETITPYIELYDSNNGLMVFNAIQSSEIIEENYNPPTNAVPVPDSGGTNNAFFYTRPPGFMFDLNYFVTTNDTVNFDIEVFIDGFNGGEILIYSQTVNAVAIANENYDAVRGKLILYAGLGNVRVHLTNNSAGEQVNCRLTFSGI